MGGVERNTMSDQGSADEEPGDDLLSEASWDGEVWDVDDEDQSEDGGDGGEDAGDVEVSMALVVGASQWTWM